MTTNNTPIEAEIEAAYIRGSNSANAANKLLREENATLREKLANGAALQQQLAAALGCDVSAVTVENVVAMRDTAERGLNYITNTESELGETLGSGELLRATLAPFEKKGG